MKTLETIRKEPAIKRYGYIYERICSKANIRKAILRASKGKRKRKNVQRILNNISFYINEIHEMLVSETYKPAEYQTAIIREGIAKKERLIHKPNFYPDQIIHWALILQLSPLIMKGMYEFVCGSLPGRGVHYGKKYVKKWIIKDKKNTKYYLKTDITKFYPSVSIPILEQKLLTIIKDKKVLNLIHLILSLIDGLPIGILLSQWFGNFYLKEIDHYIKQELGVVYYIRYMDDMVFFGRNKKELHKVRKLLDAKLEEVGLKINSNWQVCKLDKEPLDFMGFRFYRNKTTLRRKLMLRITRRVKRVYKKKNPTNKDASGVISSLGWIKHSDSHWLCEVWIKPYLEIKKLKAIIRSHSKGVQNARSNTTKNPKRNNSCNHNSRCHNRSS